MHTIRGKAKPASTSINSSPYSKTQVFLPISCSPPRGITLRAGVLLLDLDESLVDLFTVEFVLDCIILKFIKGLLVIK